MARQVVTVTLELVGGQQIDQRQPAPTEVRPRQGHISVGHRRREIHDNQAGAFGGAPRGGDQLAVRLVVVPA